LAFGAYPGGGSAFPSGALFQAILGYREGTPWRNFEDGVEHS
jgi:hypothetical protein